MGSSERRSRIVGAWELLQQLAKMCQDHGSWLAEREAALRDIRARAAAPQLGGMPALTARLEAEKAQLEARAPAKQILDASYSKLAQDSRFTPESLAQVCETFQLVDSCIGRSTT